MERRGDGRHWAKSRSETDRRDARTASSKCDGVISGTGSGSSTSSMASSSPVAFSALRRSRSMSRSIFSRMAIFAARWQISVRSAPVYFSVLAAKKSRSTSRRSETSVKWPSE